MSLKIPEDADPGDFVHHHENFYTGLIALGLLKAKGTTAEKRKFEDLRIWWKPEEDSEGHHSGDLLSKSSSVGVLQSYSDCPGVPNLRLYNSDTLVLVETKLQNPLEDSQIEAINWLAGRCERVRACLVLAPGGFGTAPFQTGELDRAYNQGKQVGTRVGFINLALTVTWACDQLELETLE